MNFLVVVILSLFGGAGRARTDDDGIMSSVATTGSKSAYACLR